MNVMKQDAMDDKITEGWKTCEKKISQQEKKNVKHIDLKTHTHTHTHTTSLTNFIFQNKSRQFSKYTLTHVDPCDGQITLYLHMYQE